MQRVTKKGWFIFDEGTLFVDPGEWKRIPVQAGDKFLGFLDDTGKLVRPPMITISIDDKAVLKALKQQFRCSAAKAGEFLFHMKSNAKPGTLFEYLDDRVSLYVHAPIDSILYAAFDGAAREQVIRFFRWWHKTIYRRLELLGVPKEELKAAESPFDLYEQCLKNPFSISSFSIDTIKEIAFRTGRAFTPSDEKLGTIVQYLRKRLENGSVYSMYPEIQRQFSCSTEEFFRFEAFGIYAEQETQRVYLKTVYDDMKALVDYIHTQKESQAPKRTPNLTMVMPGLNPAQKMALVASLQLPLTIITGEGGSGKSTVISEIFKQEPNVHLLSFTGKAVSHLVKITDSTLPSTIHKAIANAELHEGVDHIVIDEASMVSSTLLLKFFRVCNPKKHKFRLTFVGDPNQLPPTEWGECFRQMIDSKTLPVFHLTENMRLSTDENGLRENIQNILHYMPDETYVKPFAFKLASGFIVKPGTLDDAVDVLRLRHEKGISIKNHMILSPYRKTVQELNILSQKRFQGKRCIIDCRGNKWSLGEPVVCRVNNYYIHVMNGEEGYVHDIEDSKVIIAFRNGFFTFSTNPMHIQFGRNVFDSNEVVNEEAMCNTATLGLGYASTVHGAQGSEWDFIIIYIPEHAANLSGFLSRRLIYTMLSRTKKKVWILGDVGSLAVAVTMKLREPRDVLKEWL